MLQSNPLGDVGCRPILAVVPAVFPMLQVGDARRVFVTWASLAFTCTLILALQILNLSGCSIGKDGATSVCGVLHSLRCLKSLLLARNAISSDAVATLARTLSSRRSLQLLDLSFTGAEDAGAHALLPLLQSAGCPVELKLTDNSIGAAGAARLLEAASISHSVHVLDLSNNVIDDSVSRLHVSFVF
jgi:hypothetical protein